MNRGSSREEAAGDSSKVNSESSGGVSRVVKVVGVRDI